MPVLHIDHQTTKTRDEIWRWIEDHIENELRRKVPRENIQITEVWNECTFKLKGVNISADVHVQEKGVGIDITLPLLFTPFKGAIESGVRDALKEL